VFVEVPIVLARSKFSVFLSNKEEGGCHRQFGFSNITFSEVFVNEFFGGIKFSRGQWIGFERYGCEVVCPVFFLPEVNFVVIGSRWRVSFVLFLIKDL